MSEPLTADTVREWGRLYSNWGRWGPEDDKGTLNFITPARVLEACAEAGCELAPGRGETDCTLAPGRGETELFLRPGSRFRAVDALLTNFHLPRSSLLLLVAAFAGRERVLAAYAEAVRHEYRFYSYGDAMLIL